MSLAVQFRRIARQCPPDRRIQFFILLSLIALASIGEMVSIGAIVPLLAVLMRQSGGGAPSGSGAIGQFLERYPISTDAMIIIFCVAILLSSIVRLVTNRYMLRFSFQVGADLGRALYSAILWKDYSWHVGHNSAEMLAAMQKVTAVTYNVIVPFFMALVSLVLVIAIFVAMVVISPSIALVSAATFGVIYFGLTSFFRKRLIANGLEWTRIETARIKEVQEGLGSIRDVIIGRMQMLSIQRFSDVEYYMRKVQARSMFLGTAPRFLIEGLVLVSIGIVAFVFSRQPAGFLSVAPVLGGLALGAQKLLPQGQQLYASWAGIAAHVGPLDDVLNMIEQDRVESAAAIRPEAIERFGRRDGLKPLIAFKGAAFRYEGTDEDVLSRIDLSVWSGSHVALTGKSGSGKSTLMDLMLGLLSPTTGSIEVNGVRLTKGDIPAWQSMLAHVPQSIYLIDASILENIALGVPRKAIDRAAARAAAAKAQLIGFIDSLPDGIDTVVGERGARLSGGQRQRIGLARALYTNASVLFFDEATSALDDATELSVVEALRCLGPEYTVITIAHRQSTLKHCDTLFVVEGRTVRQISKESEEQQRAH